VLADLPILRWRPLGLICVGYRDLRIGVDEAEDRQASTFWPAGEATNSWNKTGAESPHEVHTATWHPARVLREVDAKRRLVDEHRSRGDRCRVCTAEANGHWRRLLAPCPTLMFLAVAYADHPVYRGEWRP
jgi:hypothetical protein